MEIGGCTNSRDKNSRCKKNSSHFVDEQGKQIQDILYSKHSTILVAEKSDNLVGYVGTYRENFNRCRHSAYVVIGILTFYHGQGIGALLFNALEKWAKDNGCS
ncbi:GNAT family N-acetyltransferase [Bacillus sp. CGMCC 1.60114]|uniref:GNAT family N-acetyltransferase n=1 Tax=unclassified Bacillus (in: firmicutes) TaxID=185979 RepID=UPI00364295A0